MRLKNLIVGLLAATVIPLVASANILPEGAFWNKDTAYVEPAPAVSTPATVTDEEFYFTSTWNLSLLFYRDFKGVHSLGLILFVK